MIFFKKFLLLILIILLNNSTAIELSTQEDEDISLKNDPLFQVDTKDGLNLHEAIELSIQNNPKFLRSRQSIFQAKRKIDEAFSGHLPTVDVSGNAGYESRTYTPENALKGPNNTDRFRYKKTELYLNIKENIWAGGSIENGVDEQKQRLSAIMYEHQNNIEKLSIEMIQTYFDIVYGKISLKINEKNMQDFKKVLKIMKIKEENGAATKGDLNFILANVDNAKTELIRTQSELENAISFYAYLIGEQESKNLPFESEVALDFVDLNTSLNEARLNNAVIQRQKAYAEATKYSFEAQKGSYQPTIDLLVNGETRREYNTITESDIDPGSRRDKGSILLSFKYNLYRGGKDEAKSLRLYAKMNEFNYTLADETRKVIFRTKVLYQSVDSLEKSLALTESEVISARKVVSSYWISFKEGTQDLQALQLALRSLNRAELDYTRFKKNLYIDNFKLLQNRGKLLPFLDLAYSFNPDSYKQESVNFWW